MRGRDLVRRTGRDTPLHKGPFQLEIDAELKFGLLRHA
jgi:hypothetical protein